MMTCSLARPLAYDALPHIIIPLHIRIACMQASTVPSKVQTPYFTAGFKSFLNSTSFSDGTFRTQMRAPLDASSICHSEYALLGSHSPVYIRPTSVRA